MKKSKLMSAVAALLVGAFVSVSPAGANVPGPVPGSQAPLPAQPSGRYEYFQLSLPLATKPVYISSHVTWTSLVDHTPPFYSRPTSTLQVYTGESVTDPSGGCGFTAGREYCYNGHSGMDMDLDTGTPVYAAHAGKVVVSRYYGGYGMTVVLRDEKNPAFLTLYGHLSDNPIHTRVGEGTYVRRGERIAYGGNTGNSTCPHLHFGLYYDTTNNSNPSDQEGKVLDPYGWFSQGTNYLNAPVNDIKWADGYPATSAPNEPIDWNEGTMSGNTYVNKIRTRYGPYIIGASPNVDAIEQFCMVLPCVKTNFRRN